MIKFSRTKFKGLYVFDKHQYRDARGYFLELFKKKTVKQDIPFYCISYSKKNVLRGLHLQVKNTQAKYISVLKGKILDIAVDLRKNSKTFGKHFKIVLSERNSKSIFIPKGFAHGFFALDKENYMLYGCSDYRNKNAEVGIIWNDKDLNIKWPKKNIVVSTKDKKNISFQEFKKKYL
tara:strand:- start:1025 stop:1555 length:531 start_codon:yes stop_codon:yes gene_type:complete